MKASIPNLTCDEVRDVRDAEDVPGMQGDCTAHPAGGGRLGHEKDPLAGPAKNKLLTAGDLHNRPGHPLRCRGRITVMRIHPGVSSVPRENAAGGVLRYRSRTISFSGLRT